MTVTGYQLRLTTKSVLLIGGQHSSLTLDKMTARYTKGDERSQEGQPYIPASTLKGAMRIDFERLVRTRGIDICHAPDPERMCSVCPACRLFGNPRRPGKLRFFDARLRNRPPLVQQSYQERTGVALSRVLRRAAPKKLFNFETTATGMELVFESRIECLEELTDEEKQLFEDCLRWWSEEGLCLGSNRSRGLGWLHLQYKREERSVPIPTAATPATALHTDPNPQPALYRVVFKPEEWLRVSGPKPRQYLLPTLRFIPGSTLRGALAQALKQRGTDDATLEQLFLHQPLAISHLYPERFELGRDALRPATAWECKLDPSHGPYDLLIDRFLYWKGLELGDQLTEEQREQLRHRAEECLICGSSLRPSGGFQELVSNLKLYAKLALNRTLMRAEQGMFYLYEAMKSKQFEGLMLLTPEQYQAFSSIREVIIGGARSKGFGRGGLTINRAPSDALGDQQAIQRRLTSFNEVLKQRTNSYEPLFKLVNGRCFFTLDLLTDLVLPPGMTLRQILQRVNGIWKWETAVLHWIKVGGYNEATGQQKPLLSALGKGGTVLLSVANSDLNEQTIQQLADLESQGLGLKRDEGFGWVQVCSPFHVEGVR